ncbi:MAG: hypothetical protein KGH66_02385 [Candidatus Micrarchaeota archaeon]|nr:hypothetical protein [Candidatus Micrarchaeota archaeon]
MTQATQTKHETYSDIQRKLKMLMAESYDDQRRRLANLIRLHCVEEDPKGFKLKSGEVAPQYINVKKAAQHPVGALLIGRMIHDMVVSHARPISHIGGKVTGGIVVSQSVVTLSALTDNPLKGFYVRDTTKEYATKTIVEGLKRGEKTKLLVAVDDVSTTGNSLADAIEVVQNTIGAEFAFAVSVVNRQRDDQVQKRTGVKHTQIFTEQDIFNP